MQILSTSLNFDPLSEPLHMAVGNFDGLHLGHQKLLQKVQTQRRLEGGRLAVYSFFPHPQSFFSQTAHHVYLEKRSTWYERLKAFGVDLIFEENFTTHFSQLSAEEFLSRHWQNLNLKSLVVGEDFRFGSGRKGDLAQLQSWSENKGLHFFAIPPVLVGQERVSTTLIKSRLMQGELEGAQELLGRPFSIRGLVIPGEKKGRELGFPTLNLQEESASLLKLGVYLSQVRGPFGVWPAITNVGVRPTVHAQSPVVIESHVLGNFHENLYHQQVEIEFLSFVRSEKKFSSLQDLKSQIAIDVEIAKRKFQI